MLPFFTIRKTPEVRPHRPIEVRLGTVEKRLALLGTALQVIGLIFVIWMIIGNYYNWWQDTAAPANTTTTPAVTSSTGRFLHRPLSILEPQMLLTIGLLSQGGR
jgi:hypothetical protein